MKKIMRRVKKSSNGRPDRPHVKHEKPDIRAMLGGPVAARRAAAKSSHQPAEESNAPPNSPQPLNGVAAVGTAEEIARRAMKKAQDRRAAQPVKPSYGLTDGILTMGGTTATPKDDEILSRQPLTDQQLRKLKEETAKSAALQRQRDEDAARKQHEEDERKKALRAAREAERIANSPFGRLLERLLKLTAKSDEDRFVLVCHQIVEDLWLSESDKNELLAQYVKQRPFGPSIDETRIAKGLANAQRHIEASKAAYYVGMFSPSRLLKAAPKNVELIPGVIPAGQFGTISGAKNTLKTKIAVDLSVSLATKSKFLDCWPVTRPLRCGIIASEDSRADIHACIHRICRAKGIDPDSLEGKLFVGTAVPSLGNKNWLEGMSQFIELNRIENLVIEAPYLGLDGADQRSLSAMGDALAPIKRLCDDTGCAIQVAVHHKRVGGSSWPALHDITGVGYEEVTRYWLVLNSRRNWDPATGEHQLRLVVGNKHREDRFHLDVREGHVDDPGGRIWEVNVSKQGEGASPEQQGRSAQRAQAVEQLGKYEEKVLRLLEKHPDGLTLTAIGAEAKVPEKRRKEVIAALLASEQIDETLVKVSNHKTQQKGYKMRQRP